MSKHPKFIKHKQLGMYYQRILCTSVVGIKYICWSIMIVLGLSFVATLVFGPAMFDIFIIYCTTALGSAFVFGGTMNLFTLYHLICANYYWQSDHMGSDSPFSFKEKKQTLLNCVVGVMIHIQIVLGVAVLMVGGIGALSFGISKLIGVLVHNL